MTTSSGGSQQPSAPKAAINVILPSTPGQYLVTKVRVQSGGTGAICSTGKTTGSLVSGQIYGIVTPPGSPPPPVPSGGPGPSTAAGWTQGVTPTATSWQFVRADNKEIPNAQCNTTGTAQNLLTLVGQFVGGVWVTQPVNFCGLCSTTTECGDYGELLAQGKQNQGGSTRGVDTAPHQYRVEAQGFIRPFPSSFNGSWLLRWQPREDLPWVWHNDGDGQARPHVELFCDGPVASLWQLLFKLGTAVVRYSCSACQWRALGANVLRLVDDAALAAASVPSSLTAEPC